MYYKNEVSIIILLNFKSGKAKLVRTHFRLPVVKPSLGIDPLILNLWE